MCVILTAVPQGKAEGIVNIPVIQMRKMGHPEAK
jgi:hypothetical protein